MRILWNLFKVILGLAIAIPLGIFALASTVGILGALVGLGVMVLRLAFVAFLVIGGVKLARALFGAKPAKSKSQVHALPAAAPADPYYDAAMREINREMGLASR